MKTRLGSPLRTVKRFQSREHSLREGAPGSLFALAHGLKPQQALT
jgi:hypothetical protein